MVKEVEQLLLAAKAEWEGVYGPTFDVGMWNPHWIRTIVQLWHTVGIGYFHYSIGHITIANIYIGDGYRTYRCISQYGPVNVLTWQN